VTTRSGRRRATALTVLLLLLGACVEPPVAPLTAPEPLAVEELDLPPLAATSLARRAQAVTVRIRSLGCDQLGLGSGFVLPGGVVVTNRHVLDQPRQVTINTWDGRSLEASVTGVAVDSDLAVLQLGGEHALPEADLRTTPVEPGERVYAVGYPAGGPATVSEGQVVGLVDGTLLGEPADVIRVDAQIRQGNSGGPLFDADGAVVGVVFALETQAGTGLAVPVTTLLERLDAADLAPPEGC
jgi:S1-C subfamily serine protease